MEKSNQKSTGPQVPEEDRGFTNVAKWIFLLGVLTASWFLLDWLMSGK